MHPDELVVEQVLRGEREKFGILVERYQRQIYRFLRGMGLEHDDAADVMQSAFVRAYDKLSTLKGGDRFRVWLYSIAANQARNYLRSQSRLLPLKDLEIPAEDENADLPMERKRLRDMIDGSLARLPEEQRRVVLLRIYEDLPFKDVAAVCGITLSSAKVTYHRALKTMQRWLKPAVSRLDLNNP